METMLKRDPFLMLSAGVWRAHRGKEMGVQGLEGLRKLERGRLGFQSHRDMSGRGQRGKVGYP